MKVQVIVEKIQNGQLWGRTSRLGSSFVTGYGENVDTLLLNIKESMRHFQQHEGKKEQFWSELEIDAIAFEVEFKSS